MLAVSGFTTQHPRLCGPWEHGRALNDGRTIAAIQPSILTHSDGSLQILSRTRHGRIAGAWSFDGGDTFGKLRSALSWNAKYFQGFCYRGDTEGLVFGS